MALQHAAIYAFLLVAVLGALSRWRTEPTVALIIAATTLALGSGFWISATGKSFSAGFGAAAAESGMVVVAAALVAEIAESSGAAGWLARATSAWRFRALLTPLLGILAGPGSWPTANLAVTHKLAQSLGGRRHGDPAVGLALAISAAHGLLPPSPILIASTTILGADWRLVLEAGLPCTLIVVALSEAMQAMIPAAASQAGTPPPKHESARHAAGGGKRRGSSAMPLAAVGLGMATALMVGMLIVRSLGDIPSEPLGGGPARELAIGVGRPIPLLVAGCAIMLAATWRWRPSGLAHQGWAGVALARTAPLVLLLGAAGGLQSIAYDTHMAEELAEQLATWHLGLAVPFLMAALFKVLQGSSITAAIATAGILQPAMLPLGLDDPGGRALVALAVGAGSVSGTNINDGFFWLIASFAPLRPVPALLWITCGTLLQGALALALIWAAWRWHYLALFGA